MLNLVEAGVLHQHLGERFRAVVVQVDADDDRTGDVFLRDPAVAGRVTSAQPLPLGSEVLVELVEADPVRRTVRFAVV